MNWKFKNLERLWDWDEVWLPSKIKVFQNISPDKIWDLSMALDFGDMKFSRMRNFIFH
jgi:hypothetical protein